MRTRFSYWAAPATAAAVASAVVAVHGQDPAQPRFFPNQGTPVAPTGVRQAGYQSPNGTGVPPGRYNGPPPIVPAGHFEPQSPQPARPRLTQPVVAGPDGVRPVQATEPIPGPAVPQLGYPPSDGRPIRVEMAPPGTPESIPTPGAVPPPQEVIAVPFVPNEATSAPLPSAEPAPQVGSTSLSPPGVGGSTILPPASPTYQPTPATAPALFPTQVAGSGNGSYPGNPLPAKQTPNVEVAMVAPESVGVGMPLTYELVVRNVGTVPVANVRVEDELPARGVLVAVDPQAEAVGDRLGWPVGALDAGAERRIKVTVKLADEGEVRSRATVSFSSAVDARVRVTRPRVTVAVTGPEAGAAKVGEKVPFTLRLSNSGSGTASQVIVQARFSDGLLHPHGQLIEAPLANLAAGQTKTITLEAVATKAGPQTCTITTAADGNPPESARAGVTLVEPLLALRQTGPARCLVKSEPTYSLELTNPGTAATDPLTVWTVLPDGFEFVQATDGGAFTPGTKTVSWRLAGLPAGQARALSLKVRAVGPTDGVIRTSAQAATPGSDLASAGNAVVAASSRTGPAGRPLEAKAETVVKAEGVPALRFDVTAAEGVVEVGKEAVYEIRVVNQGTGPCTGVQIVTDLADGTVAGGASGPTTARGNGQQVVFDPLPQLAVREEKTYRVRVRGTQPGDMRFHVRLTCNEVRTPTVKEENTRFFKE